MMRDRFVPRPFSRRDVLRGAGAAGLGLALGSGRFKEGYAKVQTPPTRNIQGTQLRILLWSHFVPVHDEWFDGFVQEWGTANDV